MTGRTFGDRARRCAEAEADRLRRWPVVYGERPDGRSVVVVVSRDLADDGGPDSLPELMLRRAAVQEAKAVALAQPVEVRMDDDGSLRDGVAVALVDFDDDDEPEVWLAVRGDSGQLGPWERCP